MSTETPETKSAYQLRREALSRAIAAWQDDPADPENDSPLANAEALEDALMDEDLIVLPRSTGHGKWVVEVGGKRAPILPGSDRSSGLLDAEEAADLFLTLSAADEYAERQPTVRPATDMEFKLALADHLFGGVA
ncbi:hypothetical protein AB0L65_32795 [Nonomuraea sp. NPDC052116]|uniref:hypothetical protein n=1 Tax=Nonomuraea sp. NPDC052116 TaxID=3155665 RepID=UPI003441227D